eukprot:g39634.t1
MNLVTKSWVVLKPGASDSEIGRTEFAGKAEQVWQHLWSRSDTIDTIYPWVILFTVGAFKRASGSTGSGLPEVVAGATAKMAAGSTSSSTGGGRSSCCSSLSMEFLEGLTEVAELQEAYSKLCSEEVRGPALVALSSF